MDITYTMCLPRDEISVPIVRRLSGEALRALGVTEDCVADIQVAVSEACTNVLKHALGLQEQYDVEVEVNNSTCVIRVIDAGVGFDAVAAAGAEQNLSAEGGRGIFLMKALVDDLQFISKPEEGTVVHLEKRLSLRDGAVLARLQANAAGAGPPA